MKRKVLLCIIIAACFIAAMCIIALYKTGNLVPHWVRWSEREISFEECSARLKNKIVTAQNAKEIFWQSGEDIKVQDMLLCDIDHDGEEELMLLCWRRGRYGASRPFWETEEDKSWSQHIYIYDFAKGKVTPVWMASYIGIDVASWHFDSERRLCITARDGTITRWDWVSWGLERIG